MDRTPDSDETTARERAAALGELTAGLAHEIATPLGAVLCAQSARKELVSQLRDRMRELAPAAAGDPEFERLRRQLDESDRIITAAVTRILELSKQVRRFLDNAPAPGGRVDLVTECEGALLLADHLLRGRHVERRLDPVPQVVGTAPELGQVVLELVVNACRSLGPSGGTLTLTTRERDGGVEVEVRDDGPGVPSELRERIFENGLTTRRDDGGSGRGLALARGIARRHGGDLVLEDGDGGSVFVLRLPAADAGT